MGLLQGVLGNRLTCVCVCVGNPEGSWDHCAQSPFSWKGEEGKGPRTTISALSKLFLKPIAGLSFTQ